MSEFGFRDAKGVWVDREGREWKRPLMINLGRYRLFHDSPIDGTLWKEFDAKNGELLSPYGDPPYVETSEYDLVGKATEVVEDAATVSVKEWEQHDASIEPHKKWANDLRELATGYPLGRYANLVEQTFEEIKKLSELKGGEYSGDNDRLANFRRNGNDLELPMETIWRVYAAKHWDAIGQYIRDNQSGRDRTRLEGIGGRVDDLIVYLLLFKAMLDEKGKL